MNNKILYYIILSLFFTINCKSQVIVSNIKDQILFKNFPNIVDIGVEGYNTEDLDFEISKGSVKRFNDSFLIQIDTTTNPILDIFHKKQLIKTIVFKSFKLPKFNIIVDKYEDDYFNIEKLNDSTEISIKALNSQFTAPLIVKEFEIEMKIKGGFNEEIKSTSNMLTPKQLEFIRKQQIRTYVTFKIKKVKTPISSNLYVNIEKNFMVLNDDKYQSQPEASKSKVIKIRKLPEYACYGEKYGGNVSRNYFKENYKVKPFCYYCKNDFGYKVDSFSIMRPTDSLKIKSKSNVLSEEQLNFIEKQITNSQIKFTDIYISKDSTNIQKQLPFIFTIDD